MNMETTTNNGKKVYLLGGYGSLASIDIATKLVRHCKNAPGRTYDSQDVKFCLDSHPDDTTCMTLEDCVFSLKAGLDRARAHCLALNQRKMRVMIGCNTMHAALKTVNVPEELEILHIAEGEFSCNPNCPPAPARPPHALFDSVSSSTYHRPTAQRGAEAPAHQK